MYFYYNDTKLKSYVIKSYGILLNSSIVCNLSFEQCDYTRVVRFVLSLLRIDIIFFNLKLDTLGPAMLQFFLTCLKKVFTRSAK